MDYIDDAIGRIHNKKRIKTPIYYIDGKIIYRKNNPAMTVKYVLRDSEDDFYVLLPPTMTRLDATQEKAVMDHIQKRYKKGVETNEQQHENS